MSIPFGEKLPWWTTLLVTPQVQDASFREDGIGILVAKDGTLSVGIDVAGLELEGAETDTLNGYSAVLGRALADLPDDAYIQTVFETGEGFERELRFFATQGGAGHQILQRGRKLRRRQFDRGAMLSRARITYYVGWKRALGHLALNKPQWQQVYDALRGAVGQWIPRLETDLQVVRLAALRVVDVALKFIKSMRAAGIQATALDEASLIRMCHRAVNPTLWRQVRAPVYLESQHEHEAYLEGGAFIRPEASLSAQLPLTPLDWNAHTMVTGQPPIMMRALGLTGGPAATTPSFLNELYFAQQPTDPFRLVVTHQPYNRDKIKRRLKLQRLVAGALSKANTDFADFDQEKKRDAADALLARVSGDSPPRLFDTSMVVIVTGATEEALDEATETVTNAFVMKSASATVLQERQIDGWIASLPANGYSLPPNFRFLQRNVAHTMPVWLPSTGDPVPDLLFDNRQRGVTALTVRPGVKKNRAAANAQIIGETGVGKTLLFSHIFKYGILDSGGHVVISDIKGPKDSSYKPLCELLDGHYVCLRDDPDACFNPIASRNEVILPSGGMSLEDVESVKQLLLLMVLGSDEVSHAEKMDWDHVASGVLKEMYFSQRATSHPLVLDDVMKAFKTYTASDDLSDQHRGCAEDFAHRLGFFCTDTRRRQLFGRPQSVDMSNPFTVFDFAGMKDDKELGSLLISVMAMRIDAKLRGLPPEIPKLFGFDEVWSLFGNERAGELLERLYRTGRSTGAAAYILSQSIFDSEKSPAGRPIDDNTTLYYLARHPPKRAKKAADRLGMADGERELFYSLQFEEGAFAEFLLRDTKANTSRVIQYFPTAFDLWCDTSAVSDVAMRKKAQKRWGLSLLKTITRLAAKGPPRPQSHSKAPAPPKEQEKMAKPSEKDAKKAEQDHTTAEERGAA